MNYREMKVEIDNGEISGGRVKLWLSRNSHIYHEISRTALKKLILAEVKSGHINLDSTSVWEKVSDHNKEGTHHLTLNY